MNLVQSEADTAIAEEYEGALADSGRQAENVEIDGVPTFGQLTFDPETVQLIGGGWNAEVTGIFSTRKSYFVGRQFPRAKQSTLQCIVGGHARIYQITHVDNCLDNRAHLNIGLGAFTNRK